MGLYHLRDNRLSAKAKGIMSVILSLPDSWFFSRNGIFSLFGVDGDKSILSGIDELKDCGYLKIDKITPSEKNAKYSYVYNWYERPLNFSKNNFSINFDSENEMLKPNQAPQNRMLDNENKAQNVVSSTPFCSASKGGAISNIDKEILNITTGAEERQETYQKLDEYIPACNTIWIEAVDKYLDKLPYKLVIRAIQETAEANKRDCRYFKAICERWLMNNYKTLEEIENDKNDFQSKRQKSQELKDKAREAYIKDVENKNNKKQHKQMDREEYNKLFSESVLKNTFHGENKQ